MQAAMTIADSGGVRLRSPIEFAPRFEPAILARKQRKGREEEQRTEPHSFAFFASFADK